MRIVFVMGFKTNLFALSDELPRTNILNYPPASAEETLAQLDKIWPGKFTFDSEETIADPALAIDPRERWSLCITLLLMGYRCTTSWSAVKSVRVGR